MKLLVVRHGPAGDKEKFAKTGKPDEMRPLTPKGKEKTAEAALGLKAAAPRPAVVLTSPLLRAKQTAQILTRRLKLDDPDEIEELKPSGDYQNLLKKIVALKLPTVVIVGHEPHLSGFVSFLLAGKPGLTLALKKAGACLLEIDDPSPGKARLAWLLTPAQLRQLAPN